jgi:hypothetical protein
VDDGRDAEQKARLRAAIVTHLREHPLAGDTEEGILACWILAADRANAAQFIGEVIDAMLMARELVAVPLPGGAVLYVPGPALDAA